MATHPALRRFRRRPPGDPGLELAAIHGNVLRPHVLLRGDAVDTERLEREAERLRGEAEGVGEIVNEQHSAYLPSGRNHFGYVEGAGAVAVLGSGLTPQRGEGTPEPWRAWRALKP